MWIGFGFAFTIGFLVAVSQNQQPKIVKSNS